MASDTSEERQGDQSHLPFCFTAARWHSCTGDGKLQVSQAVVVVMEKGGTNHSTFSHWQCTSTLLTGKLCQPDPSTVSCENCSTSEDRELWLGHIPPTRHCARWKDESSFATRGSSNDTCKSSRLMYSEKGL